jgi:hypothetical protein
MDALPSSRIHMMVMGIDGMNPTQIVIRIWNYSIRTVTVVIMLSLVSLQLYGVTCFEKVLIINAVHITIFSIEAAMYIRTFKRSQKLFNMLKFAFSHMDKHSLDRIASFDNHQVSIKFCFSMIITFALMIYFSKKSIQRIQRKGFKEKFPRFFTRTLFACIVWSSWVTMFQMQMYISILFVTDQIAKQIKSKFLHWHVAGGTDYDMMRRSLDWYNRMMEILNEEAGMIPFGCLAIEFMLFACAISSVVTGSEFGVFLTPVLLITGSLNVSFIRTFYQMIQLSNKSRRTSPKPGRLQRRVSLIPSPSAVAAIAPVVMQ